MAILTEEELFGTNETTSSAPAEKQPTKPKILSEEELFGRDRGFVGDTVSHLARGGVGLLETTAYAADTMLGGNETAKKAGEYLGGLKDKVGILKPDNDELAGEEGIVKRGWNSAMESAPQSAAIIPAAMAGAKAGAAVGSIFSPAGTAVGGIAGGVIGGGAAMISLFGAGTYGKQKADVTKKLTAERKDLSPAEINDMAHENALTHAYAEVGGEGAGDLAAYMIFSRVPGGKALYKGGKAILKELVQPGVVKTIGKGLAKDAPFEVGSEVGTAYFQNEADRKIGITDVSAAEAMKEAIIPALFLSTGMGVTLGGYNAYQRKQSYDALNSGTVEQRADAVGYVASALREATDESVAKKWHEMAMEYVADGDSIPLDYNIAELAAERPGEHAAEPLTDGPANQGPAEGTKPSGPISRAASTVIPVAVGADGTGDVAGGLPVGDSVFPNDTQPDGIDGVRAAGTIAAAAQKIGPTARQEEATGKDEVASHTVQAASVGIDYDAPIDSNVPIANLEDEYGGHVAQVIKSAREKKEQISVNAAIELANSATRSEADTRALIGNEKEANGLTTRMSSTLAYLRKRSEPLNMSQVEGDKGRGKAVAGLLEKGLVRLHENGNLEPVTAGAAPFSWKDESAQATPTETAGEGLVNNVPGPQIANTETIGGPQGETETIQPTEESQVSIAQSIPDDADAGQNIASNTPSNNASNIASNIAPHSLSNPEDVENKPQIQRHGEGNIEQTGEQTKPVIDPAAQNTGEQQIALTEDEQSTIDYLGRAKHRTIPNEKNKPIYDSLVEKGLVGTDGKSYVLQRKDNATHERSSNADTGTVSQGEEAAQTAGLPGTAELPVTGAHEVIDNPESAAHGHEVNTNPTESQKENGNYKKAHVTLDGLDISIENPAGSTRSGTDASGRQWSIEMKHDYGYFKGSKGHDKDHVDAFIAPGYQGGATHAYVVNQQNKDGSFDEHKVILGAQSAQEAYQIYRDNYAEGWTGGKSITPMSMRRFKKWVKSASPARGAVENANTVKGEVLVSQPIDASDVVSRDTDRFSYGVEHINAYSDEEAAAKKKFLQEAVIYLRKLGKAIGGTSLYPKKKTGVHSNEGGIAGSGEVYGKWVLPSGQVVNASLQEEMAMPMVPASKNGVVLRVTIDNGKNEWLDPKKSPEEIGAELAGLADRYSAAKTKREADRDINLEVTANKVESISPSAKIAVNVREALKDGKSFHSRQLFAWANEAYGGTQGQGIYTPKDAYDALELGINQYLASDFTFKSKNPAKRISELEFLLSLVPTQTKRTKEQDDFQQYSTPPTLAYVAGWVANFSTNDSFLEPSAGIGGLAVFAKIDGVKNITVNELSERRREVLKEMGFDSVYGENAEQLNNVLPDSVKPTVIVMNPPFSATGGRLSSNKTKYGALHIEQALKRLEPGGRLVAIVGEGMAADKPTFRSWWKKIGEEYTVRANVGMNGEWYRKYGTTFDNQILVIDKTGPTREDAITGKVDSYTDLIPMLQEVRDARAAGTEQHATQQTGQGETSTSGMDTEPGQTVHPSTADVGTGQQQPTDKSGDRGQDRSDAPMEAGSVDGGSNQSEPGGRGAGVNQGSSVETAGPGLDDSGQDREPAPGADKLETSRKEKQQQSADSVFEGYQPTIVINGARPHPADLVESAAMAAVKLPNITYRPNLPKEAVTSGRLSDVQLEAITAAGQAHQDTLPNGEARGFFIGDGTGVGKGREIAGILFDNWNQGRKKSIWVSKDRTLAKDAKRDMNGIGWSGDLIIEQGSVKAGQAIPDKDGVLYTAYSTVSSSAKEGQLSRLQAIIDWAGNDFDGVIAFDESHKMGNAISIKEGRYTKKPSQMALAALDLQRALPKAKVVYVSATGATEVSNLAYAERLGLWGEGTSFANATAFIGKISQGGIAAMEVVARDMKAMGSYLARKLAYNGKSTAYQVKYRRLEHELTDPQREIYDELAGAWQLVLQNIDEALKVTEADSNGKSHALSAFWGSHQRFFNQVLTAIQMPSVITSIKQDIKDGKAVVLQITNTNEASTNRALANAESLEDVDITPRDQLMQMIENSFPVQQYEKYEDDDGNIRTRPVVDSNGNPVINREAVAKREDLLDKLGSIKVPDAPLDQILNVFGVDKVAEVTGRSKRIVTVDDGTGPKKVRQGWSKLKGVADAAQFMADKKQILIFSEAGGTGASYHADNAAVNKRQRSHYILQAGWRADSAVQGLGRSHRSNQAIAPEYVLVTTNLKGHKRFISSIARKLSQLGALTEGERTASSQGLFTERDNLESEYAADAVQQLIGNVHRGMIRGIDIPTLVQELGLPNLVDEHGQLNSTQMPTVPRFLNRILSMKIDMQNKVFDLFSTYLDANVTRAEENGTLDVGLETLKAKAIRVVDKQSVYVDQKSGAVTEYVQLDVDHQVEKRQFDSGYKVAVNNKSNMPWQVIGEKSVTNEAGEVVDVFILRNGRSAVRNVQKADFSATFAVIASNREARKTWKKGLDAIPDTVTQREHLITGALLPIWDKLIGHPKIVRVQTGKETMLGRMISGEHISEVMALLDVEGKAVDMTPEQAQNTVLNNGQTLTLDNKWKITRSRVAGENRIEVVGTGYGDYNILSNYGAFTERINYVTRNFIPVGDTGNAALERILKNHKVLTVSGKASASDDVLFSKAATPPVHAPSTISELTPSQAATLSRLTSSGEVQVVTDAEAREVLAKNGGADIKSESGKTQGFTLPDGKVFIIPENIESGNLWGVVKHEAAVHAKQLLLKDNVFKKLTESMIVRANEDSKTGEAIRKAMARVPADTLQKNYNEEVLAYLVEQSPNIGIVRRIIARFKKFLIDMFGGKFVSTLTVDDINAMAIDALRGDVAARPGDGVKKSNVSTNLNAFLKNSKVRGILYHGSPTFGKDSYTFTDTDRANAASPLAGLGHFFTEDHSDARGYAGPGGEVFPVHVAINKPLEVNSWELPQFRDRAAAKAFQRRKTLQGHDGVHLKDEGHWIAFESNQVKSADRNSGDYSSENNDIRYSVTSGGRQEAEKAYDNSIIESIGTMAERKLPADMSVFEKILSTAEYIFTRSGATKRMFQAQLDRRDDKYQIEEAVLEGFVPLMEKAQKEDNDSYDKANGYLLDVDKTGRSFKVKRENGWEVLDKNGEHIGYTETKVQAYELVRLQTMGKKDTTLRDFQYEKAERFQVKSPKGKVLKTFVSEKEAEAFAIEAEQSTLASKGYSENARSLVKSFREMTNRAFAEQIADLRRILKEAEEAGLDEPTVETVDESRRWALYENGKKVAEFSSNDAARAAGSGKHHTIRKQADSDIRMEMKLSDIIAEMGDLRGAYFPRQRQSGGVILRAVPKDPKSDKSPIMKKFDLYLTEDEHVDPETGVVKKKEMSTRLKRMFNYATGKLPFVETLEKEARRLQNEGYNVTMERDTSTPESVFDAVKLVSSVNSLLHEALAKSKKGGVDQKAAVEINKILTSNLAEIFKGRGYLSSRISRSENYVEGFETDMMVAGTQYARGLAAGMAKKNAARKMVAAITGRDITFGKFKEINQGESWSNIDAWEHYVEHVDKRRLNPNKQPKLHQEAMAWMGEVLRNDEQIDRIMGTIKGLAVIKFLGFRVSSAVINATNMVQAVPATIASHSGGSIVSALSSIRKAAVQYGKYRTGKGDLSEEDRDIFLYITNRGWDDAQFNTENAAVLQSKVGRKWNKFNEYAMKVFGAVEKFNRSATIFAAYKELRENTALGRDDAMLKAKHISDRAHGIYGKATMPAWTRGGANPLKLTYTFQKFMHNYVLNMTDMGLSGNHKAAAYMLLSPALLAGAGATAATPILAGFLSAIGIGGDDPEEEFYSWIEETFGSDRFFRHGLAGLASINLKGSIQMNNPMPRNLKELFGAPGAIFTDTAKGIDHIRKGEVLKGGEALLPTALGSMLKATREATEGVTTGSYSPVFYGDEPIKADGLDATLRFLSFNPAKISGIREKQWKEKIVTQKFQERRAEINSLIKRYFIYKSGDLPTIYKEISRYNDLVKGTGRPDIKTIVPGTQFSMVIRRARRVNSLERMRN